MIWPMTSEKYIDFRDHPLFTPMFNPSEMLEAGVMGGIFRVDDKEKFPKIPWAELEDKVDGKMYLGDRNLFKVVPNHITTFQLNGETVSNDSFNVPEFMDWYMRFYYKNLRRPQLDNLMIAFWARYIVHMFKNSESEPMSDRTKQALFEMGWNFNYPPNNLNTPWMYQRYPLPK